VGCGRIGLLGEWPGIGRSGVHSYNFPGSNGAKSRTVRTESFATRRPATPPFQQHHLEQSALLGGGLQQEQLTRSARQAQDVQCLIDWGRRGSVLPLRAVVIDFATKARRPGSGYGRGSSRTALATLKSAVPAPTPKPTAKIEIAVRLGTRARVRAA
jgi:hypothetical protein